MLKKAQQVFPGDGGCLVVDQWVAVDPVVFQQWFVDDDADPVFVIVHRRKGVDRAGRHTEQFHEFFRIAEGDTALRADQPVNPVEGNPSMIAGDDQEEAA